MVSAILAMPLAVCAEAQKESAPAIAATPVATAPHAGPETPFELRGILVTSSGPYFGIFDSQKKQTRWMQIGDKLAGLTIKSYDAEHDAIVVTLAGGERRLALKHAQVDQQTVLIAPSQPLPLGYSRLPDGRVRMPDGIILGGKSPRGEKETPVVIPPQSPQKE
ncbi:MAG: hypothetical protein HZA31_10980 [Opitutae bacterium]|nr:hypothetical protein [Opitutae bacterium]